MTGGVVVQHLHKRYGANGPLAVEDLSFAVEPGEVYALLGRNGSGKSTTVGVLATLLVPTSGTATVAGHDVVREAAAVRRRIGVTLQETGVDVAATGRELLVLHGRLLGLDAAAAQGRAAELLETSSLADAGDRRLKEYSGGMRRRLDLAVALVGEPSVVFLDEPTTGLDPLSRQALWEEVRRLRAAGVTLLLTTQYLEEADQLADRVGILVDGALEIEGPPDRLKRDVGADVLSLETEPGDAGVVAALLHGRLEGDARVSLEVEDGGAAVPRVLAQLEEQGLRARSVALSRPSLDDVFLRVAGERLSTSEPEPEEALAS